MINSEPKEAILLKKIEVSAAGVGCQMRLGDLDGDGRMEIVMIQPDFGFDDRYFPHSVLSATAYALDGTMLWQIGKPTYAQTVCNTDIPAQIYDIDRDGNNEFLCVMEDAFCIFDGKTGELKRRHTLPDKHAHDCFAIADLEGVGYPQNIIIKNRYHQIWALDHSFNVIWTYKGNIGHYPVVCDLNGDGKDEIIAGDVVLDSDGKVMWKFDMLDFPNSVCVGDISMSHEISIVAGGEKAIAYYPDGRIKWSLNTNASISNLALGNIRPDMFGTELTGFFTDESDSEYNDGLFLTDYRGNTLFKEKRTNHIGKSEVSVIYNFDGMGGDYVLVANRPGSTPCIYDGYMNPSYIFPSNGLVEWVDLVSDGISQVLIYDGQNVEIYSANETELTKSATPIPRPQTRRLYNYTRYSYSTVDSARNALGYAIGQFSKPDVSAWATMCAVEENDEIMSRADFLVILVNVIGISGHTAEVFFDVSTSDYYYPAISAIKSLGYIDDIVGRFNPESALTAEFATEIIQKTTGITPLTTKTGTDAMSRRDTAKLILQIIQNRNENGIS